MNLTIKKAADMVGLTPRALRHYEAKGLLVEPVRAYGNYRLYSTADIVDLLRIKRLTALGFSLDQVKTILDEPEGEESVRLLHRLDDELAKQEKELRAKRQAVEEILESGHPADVLPEVAELLTHLRDYFDDSERDKMRLILLTGTGDEKQRSRMQYLLDLVDGNGPQVIELRELDARFDRLGPDSPPTEIDKLITEYTRILADVYSQAGGLPSAMMNDLNSVLYNEEQTEVIQAIMANLGAMDQFKDTL